MVVNESTTTFLNCNFEGNHAEFGGAIHGNLSSNVSITNSTFYRNSAERCGGAIFVGSLAFQSNDSRRDMLTVLASNISDNEAEECGGGVAVFHVNISTHKTKFINNLAKVDGGAIFSKYQVLPISVKLILLATLIMPQMIVVELCMCSTLHC